MDAKTQANLEFVIIIGELVIKYGIPAVIKLIKLWQVDNPTLEDIRALKTLIKPPEEYFD
jgi:hypothetical protein